MISFNTEPKILTPAAASLASAAKNNLTMLFDLVKKENQTILSSTRCRYNNPEDCGMVDACSECRKK